jgi:hypothetical protein
MNAYTRAIWVLPAAALLFGIVALAASCGSDGVTPNCSQDASDCLTAPGDAYPFPDAGTE